MDGVRAITAACVAAALLGFTACGEDDPPATPVACLASGADYVGALAEAPGDVLLGGSTPITDCLVDEQEPGALETVGQSLVDAATTLNAQARRDPGTGAAIELGYLSGAVDEAAESTGGIHEDLRLRLASAARFSPSGRALPASFERGFAEGYAAGRATG